MVHASRGMRGIVGCPCTPVPDRAVASGGTTYDSPAVAAVERGKPQGSGGWRRTPNSGSPYHGASIVWYDL
eukprot:5118874-Pleurochrysis_carterae.AAC.1